MREETKKKLLSFSALFMTLAFAVSLSWGYYQYQMHQELKIKTENQYKRALNDLVNNLNEIENSMAKFHVATSSAQKVMYLGETWKGSETAVAKFSQLPADEIGISYVETLVNQVGDFSKVMTRKFASLDNMSSKEKETFEQMHDQVIEVNRAVQKIAQGFYTENLAWVDRAPGILERMGIGKQLTTSAQGEEKDGGQSQNPKGDQANAPTSVRGGLKQLDVSLQKYPPFAYQGELDKHTVAKPLGLPEGEVNESKALAAAKEFLIGIGYKDPNPQMTGLSQEPLGGFNLTYQDAYLDVSKKGGVVTYFRDQREIAERQLDLKEATKKAQDKLAKMGWTLEVSATQDMGSTLQCELVPKEKQVRLYPDKIRLTVAMDNGQIVGFDANPYYAYHHQRSLTPGLTLAEARGKLHPEFTVLENRLAVISKVGSEEALCYEFRGTALDEEYLVYINAKDGTEEKISRVINTPRGKLLQ